jgi:hypothetical protein
MGMPQSQQQDDVATCPGVDPHGAPFCLANHERLVTLFR